MSDITRETLTREEVISVIEGKGKASRVPMYYHAWIHEGVFGDRAPIAREYLNDYPFDFEIIIPNLPDKYNAPDDDKSYRFMHRDPLETESTNKALDAQTSLMMEEIDDFVADMPNANYHGMWPFECGERKSTEFFIGGTGFLKDIGGFAEWRTRSLIIMSIPMKLISFTALLPIFISESSAMPKRDSILTEFSSPMI